MDLYLTRHGESDSATYGGLDPYLTERGNAQAQLLGLRLGVLHLDAVYSSPLIRAVQTAAAVMREQKGSVMGEIIPEAYEIGTANGYSFKEREELLSYCPKAVMPRCLPCTQGDDCPEKSMERAGRIIDYIKFRHGENDTVLLIAHGSFNTFLILYALGFPYKSGFNFSQDNTGLTLIRYLSEPDGSKRTKLVFLNDTTHLKYMAN